jgi:uncharacterized membrane protein
MMTMASIDSEAAPFPFLRVIVAVSLMVLSAILFTNSAPPARFLGCVSTILFFWFLAAQSRREAARDPSVFQTSARAPAGSSFEHRNHPLWDRWVDE